MQQGEIFVAPRIAYWFYEPRNLNAAIRIELLKRDVFLQPCDFDDLDELGKNDNPNCMYVFNLDGFIAAQADPNTREVDHTKQLVQVVKHFFAEKSLVHTSLIDVNVANVVKKEGLLFATGNLTDVKKAVPAFTKLATRLCENPDETRAYLRMYFYPQVKVKVNIVNLTKQGPVLNCLLKDISQSGMSLIVDDASKLNGMAAKDLMKAKVYLPRATLFFEKCLMMRVAPESNELDVFFDLTNPEMISPADANSLTSLIHTWLKGVIEQHGKGHDLNYLRVAMD